MMSKQKNRKRRGRGEGSIHRRADGRWRATISVGYGHDGRRKRRDVYGRTKEEVQSQLCKLQNASAKGLLTNPSRTTVAQYLERWLHDVVRNTVRASTHHNYRGVVKNHVSPHIGGVAIQKLSPAHIQSLHSVLEDSGASAETRRLVHVVLHRALKQALKWD